MRSIPILVMLIVVYSVLPFAGIVLRPLVSGVLTLTMIEGAYMSEVFRAGIQSIHHQQIEASRSLGLTSWQTMRYVVLPQGLRIVSATGAVYGVPMSNARVQVTGYAIAHCSMAALVTENKTLCWPASVDSIPTKSNQEDHVSNSTWSSRKARTIVQNVQQIVATERSRGTSVRTLTSLTSLTSAQPKRLRSFAPIGGCPEPG